MDSLGTTFYEMEVPDVISCKIHVKITMEVLKTALPEQTRENKK